MFEIEARNFVDRRVVNESASYSIHPPNSTDESWKCHQTDLVVEPEQLHVNLSTFWYCFLALITTLGLVISLVSNMIIIYLFSSTPSLRKNPSNIIAVNLSLSDLLYCTQWPSVIYCCLTQSTWILEHVPIVCQSFGFITVSTAAASILTVLVMSVERAIVIIYSFQAKNKFTIRSAWIIIFVIWLISLLSGLPPLFGKFNRYTLDPSKTSCTLDYLSTHSDYKLYILVLYVAYWISPTIIITISYIAIIVTFKKSSLSLKMVNSESPKVSLTARQRVLQDPLHLKTFIASCRRRASIETDEINLRRSRVLTSEGGASQSHPAEIPTISMLVGNKKRLIRRTSSTSILTAHHNQTAEVQPKKLGNSFRGSLRDNISKTRAKFGGLQISRDSARIYRCRRIGETCQNSDINLGTRINKNNHPTESRSDKLDSFISVSSANSQLTRTVLQFRLAKMSFYLILLWLVSWTPIASLAMINSVVKCHQASAIAVFLASTMTKLGPAFDVFIYGISHPKIKSKFKKIVRCMLLMNDDSPDKIITRDTSAIA